MTHIFSKLFNFGIQQQLFFLECGSFHFLHVCPLSLLIATRALNTKTVGHIQQWSTKHRKKFALKTMFLVLSRGKNRIIFFYFSVKTSLFFSNSTTQPFILKLHNVSFDTTFEILSTFGSLVLLVLLRLPKTVNVCIFESFCSITPQINFSLRLLQMGKKKFGYCSEQNFQISIWFINLPLSNERAFSLPETPLFGVLFGNQPKTSQVEIANI